MSPSPYPRKCMRSIGSICKLEHKINWMMHLLNTPHLFTKFTSNHYSNYRRCFLTIQFFKIIIRPYVQPEMFSLGVRSMKMHLNVSLVNTLAKLKYHRNNLVSFREWGEKEIPFPNNSPATGRCSS